MSAQNFPTGVTRPARRWWIAVIVIVGGVLAWKGAVVVTDPDPTRPVVLADVVEPGDAAGYNVLLITLDTTRADHLGCYGYEALATPAVDSLLEHGVRFDDAVTNVPVTLPSHATIFTGLVPYRHGVRNNGTYRLDAEQVTLAEILKDNGYATAAFVASFVLDKRFGLDQGFDAYDFEISDEGRYSPTSLACERGANHVTSAAIEWFNARRNSAAAAPFFLWVHYYDPHAPYESPLADSARFAERSRIAAYDAEIAFVDLHVQKLLNTLDEHGLRERTLLVLVSDHGEALGEHGEQEHGGFLYEASMRVALMFSCPSLFDRPYRVDDRLVGTVDIVPTIAELLGIPLRVPVDGQGLLMTERDPKRTVYMETTYTQSHMGCAPLFGLRHHADKFILAPRSEYYDLRRDPAELHNLYGTANPKIEALQQQLALIMGDWSGKTTASRTMSDEEAERLAALGYASLTTATGSDNLPDPKDQVPMLVMLGEARDLMKQGRYEEALVIAQEMADQIQGIEPPILTVAEIHIELGRRDEAVRVLSEYAEAHPSVEVLVALASELSVLKRFDEVERTLQAAELLDPLCGSIPMLRGDRLFEEQRYAEAAAQYRKALEIDGQRLGPMAGAKLSEALKLTNARSP